MIEMFRITLEDNVTPAFQRALAALSDTSPVMGDISEYLYNETKQNFAQQRGPDGNVWAPKSPVTIANYRRQGLGPGMILRKEGTLLTTVAKNSGPDFAEVFVQNLPYAAMMQFGGTRSQFPSLWGDIPARPFMGILEEQELAIGEIFSEWLEGVFEG